jgi:homoserine dehydrogenase
MARPIRVILIGAGNVGRRFLELLVRKRDRLYDGLGLDLIVVGVADTSGVATIDPNDQDPAGSAGLDIRQIVALKNEGLGVAGYARWGRGGVSPLEMVQTVAADLLLEASPANLEHGQPGLSCIEAALSRGMHVVTANKAPLVLAYPRLSALAKRHGGTLRFDATVTGGLPAVNLGRRDLAAATVERLEGILNLTTNYILTRMAQDGLSYEEALAQAQAAGHAEADPSLDVEGWDAASKLVILAHSVLGSPANLADVEVEGITGITASTLAQAGSEGKCIKLVAAAVQRDRGYSLSVRPTWLSTEHPLAQLGPKQMGIVYHTDISGVISAAIVEETPVPTASAMLRDVVDIYSV